MGLDSPKELFEIFPGHNSTGVKLIDYSLAHIRAFQDKERLRVAVVTRPEKLEVAEYVCQQLQGFSVETVMFNEEFIEWPGSVYSANTLFSQFNLVLLPDSFLSLSGNTAGPTVATADAKGKSLVDLMMEGLARSPVVFGCIPCSDGNILKSMGAMRVENHRVVAFQDKPGTAAEEYNCFWGCYGFRKEAAKPLYDFLACSVSHRRVSLREKSFFPPGTFPIPVYYDLGTWQRVEEFKKLNAQFFH